LRKLLQRQAAPYGLFYTYGGSKDGQLLFVRLSEKNVRRSRAHPMELPAIPVAKNPLSVIDSPHECF